MVKDSKAIYCILGAVLINLTLGTFYSIGNTAPYIASYMRNNGNSEVTSEDGTWITASFLLGQGLFLIVGAYLEQLVDCRFACIFGCVIHCASTYLTIIALKVNLLAVVLLYGFGSGLGCGSSYMASIIAAQKWFPQRKGLFTGLIVAGFGFGGLIFTTLQTLYMNPKNLKADQYGYFESEVYDKLPTMFLYMGVIFTVAQTIGCILVFPPPPESSSQSLRNAAHEFMTGTTVVDDSLPNIKGALSAFHYKIFYVIGFMMMSVAPGITFVNSLGKRYGQTFIEDDRFLATVVAVSAVANALGRLTWGYMADKFTFSTCFTVKVILFVSLIILFPFEIILSSKISYFICMLGLFFGFSGTFVLFPVFVEQVFGSRYHGVIYGILYIGLAISSILTSFLIKQGVVIDKTSMNRFWPCITIAVLYVLGLVVYRLNVPTEKLENAIQKKKEQASNFSKNSLMNRKDLLPSDSIRRENSLGSIVRFATPP